MPEQVKGFTRDREQERAAFAWDKAKAHSQDKEYANLAKSAPALIMSNGLMQTLAFFEAKAKSKPHHKALSEHICAWLAEQGFSKDKKDDFRNVMEGLHGRESSSVKYRRATEEALALLRWIRQFASALVKD
jgi:CRISPR-associated protein Cmr5